MSIQEWATGVYQPIGELVSMESYLAVGEQRKAATLFLKEWKERQPEDWIGFSQAVRREAMVKPGGEGPFKYIPFS
jgi:hypothetical protein